MITRRTISAGQPGSIKYLRKYGDKLVCVRYKYSPDTDKRITTVELIEESGRIKRKEEYPPNKNVLVKVNYDEYELRRSLKLYGGVWNKDLKLWEIKYSVAKELNITSRIKKSDT